MTQTPITNTDINIDALKTISGKTVKDFVIPSALAHNEKELVQLIMESEAMDDEEKQYWFNLTKVMNDSQKERLYDILRREKQKLAEIRNGGKAPELNPEEARKRAEELSQKRAEQQAQLAQKEAQAQSQEKFNEEELLDSVDW